MDFYKIKLGSFVYFYDNWWFLHISFYSEICELPENDFGENYETNFSYPPTKLVIGQGTAVKITAQVLSDWTGTDSSYVSLKAGDTIEVSENQVRIVIDFKIYLLIINNVLINDN